MTGILKVHVAMEDQSFYPFLLSHRDGGLRDLAVRFMAARDEIQCRYLAYVKRWLRRKLTRRGRARSKTRFRLAGPVSGSTAHNSDQGWAAAFITQPVPKATW